MANYSLGFFDGENSTLIDLSKILKSKKIEDLDEFTSKFSTKQELMNYLFNNNFITEADFDSKLRVIYKNNNITKRTGVVYSDSIEYINSVNLKLKFYELCKDIKFIEYLIKCYENSNLSIIQEIKEYLKKPSSFEPYEKNRILNDFYNDTMYRMGKFYYKGLRSLALFIYRYELKQELLNTRKIISNNSEEYTEKESILSSHGDPDFPPNSEEEQRYNKYMELQNKTGQENRDVYGYFYKSKTK